LSREINDVKRIIRTETNFYLYRYYCLSILDKHHHPDITLHQGIKLLTMCTDELKRRLPIDFKGMVVKAVKADGIIDIEFDDDKVVKSA
jgi:20S proteasome subunit beta 4